MRWFSSIFRRRRGKEPGTLSVEGIPAAPVTPVPDDAELAAQALLELLSLKGRRKEADAAEPVRGTAEYYHALADRIGQAHEAARRRTKRFLSYCEKELSRDDLPLTGKGSLAQLENELYKRIDTVEREGGELKKRWQHCLADVTVRMMEAGPRLSEE
jgi:hypothetical protein